VSAVYRVLLRAQLSRGRLAALVVAGLVVVGIGALAGLDGGSARVARDVTVQAGLALLVPVVALLIGSATLGDPTEDGSVIHLWLTPLERWRLTAAALAAAVTVIVPAAVLPVAVAAALAGAPADTVLAAAAMATAAALVYTSLFVGVGFRVRRALLWGLLYVVIWEGAVATVGRSLARLSVRLHVSSLGPVIDGGPAPRFGVEPTTAAVVLVAVAAIGVLGTTWLLRRSDLRGAEEA
jgi:ABC-2 type transport system permease protein